MSFSFYKNNGPFNILEIINFLNLKLNIPDNDSKVKDIKDLLTNKDEVLFHSKKYKNIANKTKASFCLTTASLKNELQKAVLLLLWIMF